MPHERATRASHRIASHRRASRGVHSLDVLNDLAAHVPVVLCRAEQLVGNGAELQGVQKVGRGGASDVRSLDYTA